MNVSYQKNSNISSNNDILTAYLYGGTKQVPFGKKVLDSVLFLLSALLTFLTQARIRTVVRVGGVALALVGLVGVIGAMEAGTLSLPLGILSGLLLIGVEYLCLRRH